MDTSLIRTLSAVPRVSTVERFHCNSNLWTILLLWSCIPYNGNCYHQMQASHETWCLCNIIQASCVMYLVNLCMESSNNLSKINDPKLHRGKRVYSSDCVRRTDLEQISVSSTPPRKCIDTMLGGVHRTNSQAASPLYTLHLHNNKHSALHTDELLKHHKNSLEDHQCKDCDHQTDNRDGHSNVWDKG